MCFKNVYREVAMDKMGRASRKVQQTVTHKNYYMVDANSSKH